MIRSVLTAWWRRWGGRTVERCPVKEELRAIVREQKARRPSATLEQCMFGFGWVGTVLHPEEVAAWLVTYAGQQRVERRAMLPKRVKGPGVQRDENARAQRAGARLFRKAA
eukprot:7479473-Lingulodinium_polyedra.AAC.1